MKKKGRKAYEERISSCLSHIDNEFKIMSEAPLFYDLEGVKKYLKSKNLNLRHRLQIQSFYRQGEKVGLERKEILRLISLGISDKKFNISPHYRNKYFNQVKKIGSFFWRTLFSLNIAIHSKNRPWLNQLIDQIILISPYYFLIKAEGFSERESLVIRDYIFKILKRAEREIGDRLPLKILAKKIFLLGGDREYRDLYSYFDASWSLSTLRENFKNPFLGRKYFSFWYREMMRRASGFEMDQKLRDILSADLVKGMNFGQMWIFEYYFPADKKVRNIISTLLLEMWKGGDLLKMKHVLEALKVNKIRHFLFNKDEDFTRALFQLKREFYENLLHSGLGVHYALYNLYKMGDENRRNLWWVLF